MIQMKENCIAKIGSFQVLVLFIYIVEKYIQKKNTPCIKLKLKTLRTYDLIDTLDTSTSTSSTKVYQL